MKITQVRPNFTANNIQSNKVQKQVSFGEREKTSTLKNAAVTASIVLAGYGITGCDSNPKTQPRSTDAEPYDLSAAVTKEPGDSKSSYEKRLKTAVVDFVAMNGDYRIGDKWYSQKFGVLENKTGSDLTAVKYNADGKELIKVYYGTADEFPVSYEKEYDSGGKKIKLVATDRYGSGSHYYKYDKDENNTETNSVYRNRDGELVSQNQSKYDEIGTLIEERITDKNGEITYHYKNERKYDSKGNLIKDTDTYTGHEDGLVSKQAEYNSLGNIVKETTTYADHKKGLLSEQIEYSSRRDKTKEETVYDDGRSITVYYNSIGKKAKKMEKHEDGYLTITEYGPREAVTKRTEKDSDGRVFYVQVTDVDRKGNTIRSRETQDGHTKYYDEDGEQITKDDYNKLK